eukprot:927449-Pyramimonas_sp.AAC.1
MRDIRDAAAPGAGAPQHGHACRLRRLVHAVRRVLGGLRIAREDVEAAARAPASRRVLGPQRMHTRRERQ